MSRPFEPVVAPPLQDQDGRTFPRIVELMQRLLAPDGCPWDREQSFGTLRRYVLEEACEVIDAIDLDDRELLKEELGDLALQVVFLAELARVEGSFGPDDVVREVIAKLVRRHPHVFGDLALGTADEVLVNWERIKAAEKTERGLLDGVPHSLPALYRAQRMGDKTSRVGFDWPDGRGAREKVDEELAELDTALGGQDRERIEEELGDALFSLVNLARHHGVDAEMALRKTADKFAQRFAKVEARVKERHGGWPRGDDGKPASGIPLADLDTWWNEAKERS